MLGEGSFPGPGFMRLGDHAPPSSSRAERAAMAHLPRARRSGHSSELRHLSALREAMVGAGTGRLPLHLLLSDRDFDENDYEALLALDDNVESRKGALLPARLECPSAVSSLAEVQQSDAPAEGKQQAYAFDTCGTHHAERGGTMLPRDMHDLLMVLDAMI